MSTTRKTSDDVKVQETILDVATRELMSQLFIEAGDYYCTIVSMQEPRMMKSKPGMYFIPIRIQIADYFYTTAESGYLGAMQMIYWAETHWLGKKLTVTVNVKDSGPLTTTKFNTFRIHWDKPSN